MVGSPSSAVGRPEEALRSLAEALRQEESLISPHVRDSDEAPALGLLAAAGPRAVGAPAEYARAVEAIREGYLLHYAAPRLVLGADPDLALLAGDYLYALGLERLAALGDLDAIRALADLISLSAQLDAEGREGAAPLWLAVCARIAAGPGEQHEAAVRALRAGDPSAPTTLWQAAVDAVDRGGISPRLRAAAGAVGFRSSLTS